MIATRRNFIRQSAGLAGAALAAPWMARAVAAPNIHLGACETSLRAKDEDPFTVAKRIGLDGVELYAGAPADTLQIAQPEYQAQLKAAMEATGVPAPSIMMGLLNSAPLATDPRGPAWLEQTIAACPVLGCKVILVAFFGKGDMREGDQLKTKEIKAAAERIKAAAPAAQKAGVILGIENTLSAKDNLKILDRIQHDAVKIYYDVGNSTGNGYDVPAEIRMLGDRIAQIHFKDKNGDHLGVGGEVKFEAIGESLRAINYSGWVCLETRVVGDRDEDFRKNAAYARGILGIS